MQKGFTLVEVIISCSIIAVLVGISAPLTRSLSARNDIETAISNLAQALDRAQAMSQAVRNDSAWGVKIATSTIVLFKGNTYATRDSSYDENYSIASSISISGSTEVDFAKFTGLPNASTTMVLSNSAVTNKTLNINEKGTVTY